MIDWAVFVMHADSVGKQEIIHKAGTGEKSLRDCWVGVVEKAKAYAMKRECWIVRVALWNDNAGIDITAMVGGDGTATCIFDIRGLTRFHVRLKSIADLFSSVEGFMNGETNNEI